MQDQGAFSSLFCKLLLQQVEPVADGGELGPSVAITYPNWKFATPLPDGWSCFDCAFDNASAKWVPWLQWAPAKQLAANAGEEVRPDAVSTFA